MTSTDPDRPLPTRREADDARPVHLLRELADIVRELHASLSLHEVLQVLTDRARVIVGAEIAAATQFIEDDPSPPVTAVSRSREAERAGRGPAPFDAPGPWVEVRRTNDPLLLRPEELNGAGRWAIQLPRDRRPARGWLGAPLVGPDGRNIGVVQLIDPLRDGFTAGDEALLVQLARMASVAVENARLYRAAVEARAKLGWAAHVERIRAAELRAVIDALGDGVIVFDGRGRVSLTNAAADALFAGAPLRTYRDLVERLGGPPDRRGAGTSRFECRLSTRPERWVEATVYPVPAGVSRTDGEESGGRIAVVRDVTAARHEREHREAFLGILSHELRTPITTVYAGSKVLARDARMRPELRRELAADISAEAERLFRLVEDLLVMTRVERGVLELAREPVLLQRVVPAAIRLEQVSWPTTRFVPSAPVDLPAVAGDALYVEQVVRNLLSNAAKYSPPGSEVEVVVQEARERASEAVDDAEAREPLTGVSVRVLDHGTGFHAGEADDLFELFYRSPATAAQAAGAGIGLFVCRRLVAAMGGRIWARPRHGGGAEFGFTLPRYGE